MSRSKSHEGNEEENFTEVAYFGMHVILGKFHPFEIVSQIWFHIAVYLCSCTVVTLCMCIYTGIYRYIQVYIGSAKGTFKEWKTRGYPKLQATHVVRHEVHHFAEPSSERDTSGKKPSEVWEGIWKNPWILILRWYISQDMSWHERPAILVVCSLVPFWRRC